MPDRILDELDLEREDFIPAAEDLDENYGLTQYFKDVPLLKPDVEDRIERIQKRLAIDREVILDIFTALLHSHVVLEGPPGTGKTELAILMAEMFFNCKTHVVTANEDWSTFDVIGGLNVGVEDGHEVVKPTNGHFAHSVIECCKQISRKIYSKEGHEQVEGEPQGMWLVIDEISRGRPDRYFGELFTILGNPDKADFYLSFQDKPQNKVMYLPRKFRILGTLNSVDKEFVFELSQALSRRFQFIHIGVPQREGAQISFAQETALVVRKALRDVRIKRLIPEEIPESQLLIPSGDEVKPNTETPAGRTVAVTTRLIEFIRYEEEYPGELAVGIEVGTATFIDLIRAFLTRAYIAATQDDRTFIGALDWAIASRLVPQLEGADPAKVERIKKFLEEELLPDEGTRNQFPRSCVKLNSIIRGAM